jgi:hypothetical protein
MKPNDSLKVAKDQLAETRKQTRLLEQQRVAKNFAPDHRPNLKLLRVPGLG